jgi:hypothetical protein
MILELVTMTGADESVSPTELLALSGEFPFVEWGILLGTKRGVARYPDRKWISELVGQARTHNQSMPRAANLSLHICGPYARSLAAGDPRMLMGDMHGWMDVFQRVQINFHAEKFDLLAPDRAMAMARALHRFCSTKEYIFQVRNDDDIAACREVKKVQLEVDEMLRPGVITVPLFDASGGKGVLPEEWPGSPCGFGRVGYAGGLGPDCIDQELVRICNAAALDHSVWIDMESHVRNRHPTGDSFDLYKVREVLQYLAPYIGVQWNHDTLGAMLKAIRKGPFNARSPASSIETLIESDRSRSYELGTIVGLCSQAGIEVSRGDPSNPCKILELVNKSALDCVRELIAKCPTTKIIHVDAQGSEAPKCDLDATFEFHRTRENDLECLILVYDATLMIVNALGATDSAIAQNQIKAATDAHLEIMGEPSMVGFSRHKTELSNGEADPA